VQLAKSIRADPKSEALMMVSMRAIPLHRLPMAAFAASTKVRKKASPMPTEDGYDDPQKAGGSNCLWTGDASLWYRDNERQNAIDASSMPAFGLERCDGRHKLGFE